MKKRNFYKSFLNFKNLLKFQITEETKNILEKEGFEFECRGIINVKGKGDMKTYFIKVSEEDLNLDFSQI